ncbi:hypothetical protein GCM10022403_010590 [Streptomyces coacervatus]|uniref:Transposase n=1 Tax=Streptomyces coacervatus TaxID=647381 RepID=A0ABP7H4B2_9ACTN
MAKAVADHMGDQTWAGDGTAFVPVAEKAGPETRGRRGCRNLRPLLRLATHVYERFSEGP